jgi:hypothetical protein
MSRNRKEVFVIMPFAKEFSAGFHDFIEPGCEAAGLTAVRGDQEPLGHIHTAIFERIFEAPILIADISGVNPNVFYELGIAHSMSGKVITLCREDYIQRIPFDIGPYRVLVYPKAPDNNELGDDHALYHSRVQVAVDNLYGELTRLKDDASTQIANPVQEYMASRSPMTCTTSLYIDEFERSDEQDMLEKTQNEIVSVGISGTSFVEQFAGYIEAGLRKLPLTIKCALLDPTDKQAWGFLYQLREGIPPTAEELEDFLAEETFQQNRMQKIIRRLSKKSVHDIDIVTYSGIPLFWAYWIDRERLIVGHLARNRISARHFPVMVLLRDDPQTQNVYRYYTDMINTMLETPALITY